MIDRCLAELQEELDAGAVEKDHPFRYFTFATVGLDQVPRMRTIVLREVKEDMKMIFFTDYRSKKIIHIKENNKVALLFYHSEKLLQLKVEGLARIIREPQALEDGWLQERDRARKEYSTAAAPGTILESPELLEYLDEENHFCAVEITPFRIEYLKLKSPDHVRIQFSKESDLWTGEYMVP